nr:MAG TPA: hypothetical protein [Caudoviricetes sp.]
MKNGLFFLFSAKRKKGVIGRSFKRMITPWLFK